MNMEFESAKDGIISGMNVLQTLQDKLQMDFEETEKKAKEAIRLCSEDVKVKHEELRKSIDSLQQALDELDRKESELEENGKKSAISGDTQEFNKICAELESIKNNKDAINRQKTILDDAIFSAKCKDELFENAFMLTEELKAKAKEVRDIRRIVIAFSNEQIQVLGNIINRLNYFDFMPRAEEMKRNFDKLQRSKKEILFDSAMYDKEHPLNTIPYGAKRFGSYELLADSEVDAINAAKKEAWLAEKRKYFPDATLPE